MSTAVDEAGTDAEAFISRLAKSCGSEPLKSRLVCLASVRLSNLSAMSNHTPMLSTIEFIALKRTLGVLYKVAKRFAQTHGGLFLNRFVALQTFSTGVKPQALLNSFTASSAHN